jgi:1-acyl-sn-glycerol-3-phosphate acyltransferase
MWLRRVLSSVFWAFLVASSVVLFPIAVSIWLFTAVFDRRLRFLHRFTCFWASLYTWLNPVWRVRVEDGHKIRAHFKWVSKIENFRIPFIGWNMWLNRYIRLKRGDRASVVRMLRECEQVLADGNSIMMFPEGTRSPDGRLRAFKTGAFALAQSAQRPILPIVIEGTSDALPKRGFVLQGRHHIRITVLDEVPYGSFADEPIETLTDRIRDLIASRLEKEPPPPAAS